MSKTLVVRAEYGEVKETRIVEGDVHKVLKDMIISVLEVWDPNKSDLIVTRDTHEIRVKLPLSKEKYEIYSKYNLRRVDQSTAAFSIPVYVISYDNEWVGDNVVDSRIVLVAPYVDEVAEKSLVELARQITLAQTSEESE